MALGSAASMLLALFALRGIGAIRTSVDMSELVSGEDMLASQLELSAEALDQFQAGLAMAESEEAWANAVMEMQEKRALTPEQQQAVEHFREILQHGPETEKQFTCEKLQEEMAKVIGRLRDELHPACTADPCDFSAMSIDEVVTGQQIVTSLAAMADKKKCLAETMGTQDVQDKLDAFLSFVPKVLKSAGSANGIARLQEAYVQLVSFQDGVLDLAKDMADRKLLHRIDIDFKAECPEPCQMCKKSGAFGFECILNKEDKDVIPDLSGRKVECATPTRRFWSWVQKFKFTKSCTVPDLKESAVQHVHVGAVTSCTAETILMSLNGQLRADQREDLYRTCLAIEQGNSVDEDKQATYETQAKVMDGIIPREVSLTMNSILSVGLASGLAGLRAATRGNDLPPALLEGGTLDYKAPYVKQLGDMSISAKDRDMYADRRHVRRWETLQRLGACEDVYSLKEQNTFVEGSKPLTMHSFSIAQEARAENQQQPQQEEEVVASALAQKGASRGGAPSPGGGTPAAADESGDGGNDFKPLPPHSPGPGQTPYPAPAPAPGPPEAKARFAGGTFLGFFLTVVFAGILTYLFAAVCLYVFLYLVIAGLASSNGLLVLASAPVAMTLFVWGTIGIWRFIGYGVGSMLGGRSSQKVDQCMRRASTSPLLAP